MSGKDTPVRPADFDFRRAVIHELLFSDPLKPSSVYVFGAVAGCLLAAVIYYHLAVVSTPPWLDSKPTVIGMVSLPEILVFLAWPVFIAYCVWWFFTIISAMRGVARGVAWLTLGNPKVIVQRYEKMRASLSGLEARFADLAYNNLIEELRVRNGRGAEREGVVIDVTWNTGETDCGALCVYRNTGAMHRDINALRGRPDFPLVWEAFGKPLHFFDMKTQNREQYNYYFWIEVDFYGQKILGLQTYSMPVKFGEDFEEYVRRTKKNKDLLKELEGILHPPKKKTAADQVEEELEKAAEVERKINEHFEKFKTDPYQQEEIRARYSGHMNQE